MNRRCLVGLGLGISVFMLALNLVSPDYFCVDDGQNEYAPGFREVGEALRQGEIPWLSSHHWLGGNLLGEFQFGLFSPVLLALSWLTWSLPHPWSFFALAWAHVLLLACGSYGLARLLGRSPEASLLVGVVASLNGWCLARGAANWLPAVTSLAWLPYYWSGLLLAFRGERRGLLVAGVALFLLIAAGWPYTILMAGLVTVMEMVRGDRAQLPGVVLALAGGALLGAPAVLGIWEGLADCLRTPFTGYRQWVLTVPLWSLAGLVYPAYPTLWQNWNGLSFLPSMDLANGAIPTALALSSPSWRRHRALWLLLGASLLLSISPGFGSFRNSFRWLPMVHLVLALLAAHHLDESDPESRGPYRALGVVVVGLALHHVWIEGPSLAGLGMAAATVGILAWLARQPAALRRWRLAPASAALLGLSAFLVPTAAYLPRWNYTAQICLPGGLDPNRTYLPLYPASDFWAGPDRPNQTTPYGLGIRPGNTPALAGLRFVSGYSPLQPRAYQMLLGLSHIGANDVPQSWLMATALSPDGLLAEMGTDGLVVSKALPEFCNAVAGAGWQVAGETAEAVLFHRPTVSPPFSTPLQGLVVSDYGRLVDMLHAPPPGNRVCLLSASAYAADGQAVQYSRPEIKDFQFGRCGLRTALRVPQDKPALLVLARPYVTGYRAFLNDRAIPVTCADGLLLAVELPAGSEGFLRLEFAPKAVRWTPLLWLAGLLCLGLSWSVPSRKGPTDE